MSTIELAVKKVKGLSQSQAQALLDWLSVREARSATPRRKVRSLRSNHSSRRTMRQVMAWYDSIRGTTDWEPPRMPSDLVRHSSTQ